MLHTASGKIELAPDDIIGDVPRLRARLDRPATLVLIGRRHVRSNNSWMHNVTVLVKGTDRCTLLDAPGRRRRPRAGRRGRRPRHVEAGTVESPVEVSDEMMPRRRVACPTAGATTGRARDSRSPRDHAGRQHQPAGPGHLVDVPSGNAAVNGIPVEVAPA